jgi:hypothetical protein
LKDDTHTNNEETHNNISEVVTSLTDHGISENAEDEREPRYEAELRTLVVECIQQPESLTTSVMDWLHSQEAILGQRFWYWLGKLDTERKLLTVIEGIASETDGMGIIAFDYYISGQYASNTSFASNRLNLLADMEGEENEIKPTDVSSNRSVDLTSPPTPGELAGPSEYGKEGEIISNVAGTAILLATSLLSEGMTGVRRVVKLLHEGSVNSYTVEAALRYSSCLGALGPEELLQLLRAVAGTSLAWNDVALCLLDSWLSSEHSLAGKVSEFAWQCLEAIPPENESRAYAYDQIAAQLTRGDVDRGFNLL